LCADPRFTDKLELTLHWDDFLAEVGPYFDGVSIETVIELGTVFGGIAVAGNTFRTLLTDPQTVAMDVFAHSTGAPHRPSGINPPWRLSLTPARRGAPPEPRGDEATAWTWPATDELVLHTKPGDRQLTAER
jgi:crotonobetainyl-CoA:carnitine CoA-transferase CaiB-like acyl-CoA transferase